MSIRVLVADDHPVVCEGLRGIIAREPDLEWVGAVADGSALLEAVHTTTPDVVLLDLCMLNGGGLAALHQLRRIKPSPACVVFSALEEAEQVRAAVEAGAHGYLTKNSDYFSIINAIRAVAVGSRAISPSLLPILFDTVAHQAEQRISHESGLDREALQILTAIAAGATTGEIAARLYVSEVTVKRRIQDIVERLGARNRTQAVAEAVRRGWIR